MFDLDFNKVLLNDKETLKDDVFYKTITALQELELWKKILQEQKPPQVKRFMKSLYVLLSKIFLRSFL